MSIEIEGSKYYLYCDICGEDAEELSVSYKRHKLARHGERIEIEVSQHKGGLDA